MEECPDTELEEELANDPEVVKDMNANILLWLETTVVKFALDNLKDGKAPPKLLEELRCRMENLLGEGPNDDDTDSDYAENDTNTTAMASKKRKVPAKKTEGRKKATAGHMRHAATSAAADKAVTVVVLSDDDNKTGSESPNVQPTPKLAKAGSISSASGTPASQKRAPVHAPVIFIALFVVKCSLILCCSSRKVKLLQKPLQPRPENRRSLSPKILSSPHRRYIAIFDLIKLC